MKLPGWIVNAWFLWCLVVLIAVGIPLGVMTPTRAQQLSRWIDPRLVTALITTLMAFSLDSGKLWAAFRSPGPVILGFLLNTAVVPILGLLVFPLQMHRDLQYGVLVACSVPCTLAAASVWTRKAGGNDAVSLLVTLTTSLVCFVTTPYWLSLPGGTWWGGAVQGAITLSAATRSKMTTDLILGAIVPTLLGQTLRQIPFAKTFANVRKISISNTAQVLILMMVFLAALNSGARLAQNGGALQPLGLAWAWICCAAIHFAVLQLGRFVARRCGMTSEDQLAVAFAGSQKTLPTGVLVASELGKSADMAFAIFPMLLYHASQLVIDSVQTQWWLRHATKTETRR